MQFNSFHTAKSSQRNSTMRYHATYFTSFTILAYQSVPTSPNVLVLPFTHRVPSLSMQNLFSLFSLFFLLLFSPCITFERVPPISMPNQGMGGSGSGPNSGGCWSSPSERGGWYQTCPQMDLDAYLLERTWQVYLHPTQSSAPSKSQAEPVTRVPSFSKWLPDGQTLSDIHGCHDPGCRHQVCPKVQQRQLSLLQSCHPVAIRTCYPA